MILLDTNVVSESMKPEPHPRVREWLDAQTAQTLFLSSITVAELMFGVGTMPKGRRRTYLETSLEGVFAQFAARTLSFDIDAARRYADLSVNARAAGMGFPKPDGYIAAIASTHGFAVASRDPSAFRAANLNVIDPWRGTH